MKKIFLLLPLIIMVCFSTRLKAQDFAVKTNLLYDVTASINAGAEFTAAEKWTVDVSGNWNSWNMSDGRKWKHWMLQPELRHWFCERMNGHFVGLHAHAGQFNFGHLSSDIKFLGTDFSRLKDHRFQGWFAGGGISYGYAWILNRHLNLEAEIGLGYSYVKYDVYECEGCGKRVQTDQTHHYVGPTKAAISLVYIF